MDYIHKPFSPAVVAARVQTHLALREARQRLARQLSDIRTEMETARKIQTSILPRELPRVANLEIAARYIPMSSVAGDFYDFLPVDDHRVGILVADVSGHGMPAALIASMLKIAFAAQAAHVADPARVLTGLNEALYGKFQGHYVTAAYVFIDTEKRTMLYGGAGHPPLLFRDRTAGTTRAILENGVFLGFFPDAKYSAVETPFREGDRIVLYTDGVSEPMSPTEEQFGDERLPGFVQEHGDGPAASLIDGLLGELARWTGTGRRRRAGRRSHADGRALHRPPGRGSGRDGLSVDQLPVVDILDGDLDLLRRRFEDRGREVVDVAGEQLEGRFEADRILVADDVRRHEDADDPLGARFVREDDRVAVLIVVVHADAHGAAGGGFHDGLAALDEVIDDLRVGGRVIADAADGSLDVVPHLAFGADERTVRGLLRAYFFLVLERGAKDPAFAVVAGAGGVRRGQLFVDDDVGLLHPGVLEQLVVAARELGADGGELRAARLGSAFWAAAGGTVEQAQTSSAARGVFMWH